MSDSEQQQSDYVTVRGILVPRCQIEALEGEMGGTLVPDEEALIIAALDRGLKEFRANTGRDPILLNLREDGMHWYRAVALRVNIPPFGEVVVRHKPAYFRIPRFFGGVKVG